jgi:hypothetical protein
MLTQHESQCVPALPEGWYEPFLTMLPRIADYLEIAFRDLNRDARAEAVQEGVVNALCAFRRLCERGKAEMAFAAPLARYAALQVREGRQVAVRLNVRDILSRHCRRCKGVRVEQLDCFDREEMAWREVLVEDRRAGPAATAAVRIDFAAFLASLSEKERKLALALAEGETTGAAARLFRLSAARISQLRRELLEKWNAFQGEPGDLTGASA